MLFSCCELLELMRGPLQLEFTEGREICCWHLLRSALRSLSSGSGLITATLYCSQLLTRTSSHWWESTLVPAPMLPEARRGRRRKKRRPVCHPWLRWGTQSDILTTGLYVGFNNFDLLHLFAKEVELVLDKTMIQASMDKFVRLLFLLAQSSHTNRWPHFLFFFCCSF